jgi:hypothetical protein
MLLTEESIASIAPDPQSLSGGRKLSSPSNWPTLGMSESLLWGECQGSGKDPYRISVDLEQFGYKCSCPSRKFPCKHVIALLLLRTSAPDHFAESELPEWVTTWSSNRTAKPKKDKASIDKPAPSKRAAARSEKIEAGMNELHQFLEDLVRHGISDLPARRVEIVQRIAARMTDAQAPGLSAMVSRLMDIDYTDERWTSRALEHIGKISLLIAAFRRRSSLSPSLSGEVSTLVGIPQSQEELRAQEGIKDRWAVLAHSLRNEGTVIRDSRWVFGEESGHYGCVVSYAPRGAFVETPPPPGLCIEGEAVFFEAAYPQRMLFKRYTTSASGSFPLPVPLSGFAASLEHYSSAIARSPWVESIPCYIADLLLVPQGARWFMRDSFGATLPVESSSGCPSKWDLLAHQGTVPAPYFVLLSPHRVVPLGLTVNGRYHTGAVQNVGDS